MNTGALALHEGVLFVGRYAGSGEVLVFDLDGRQIDAGFCLAPLEAASAVGIAGLAVDGDRKLWVADLAVGRVRCVNLFGRAGSDFKPTPGKFGAPKASSVIGGDAAPVDVALAESSKWTGVFVATAGKRVGAVGLYLPNGTRLLALRSMGDPQQVFDRVSSLASAGNLLWVVEAGAQRVQVFREGDFHFAFAAGRLGDRTLSPLGTPRAIAAVGDGRLVVVVEQPVESAIEGAEPNANAGLFLVTGRGAPLKKLAEIGPSEGQISHPVDVVIETIRPWPHETQAEVDRRRRAVVLDLDGDRIQVFNLAGRCYGTFPAFEECEKPNLPLQFSCQIEAEVPDPPKEG